jgi:glutaredoxin-like protein NrdH
MYVYGKPNCKDCKATVSYLETYGIQYEYLDLVENPEALKFVKSLGYLQAPVVVVSDEVHWSGFQPERIEEYA